MRRRALLRVLWAALFVAALQLKASDGGEPMETSTAVYELRVYHVAPGKMSELVGRFRDNTMRLFTKHGITSVAYWSPMDEPQKSGTFVYILRHPSREAAAANWKAFQEDPEWHDVKAKSEANGKLALKIDSTFMQLTDFSPRLS
jgi:hypothetical protein